MNFSNYYNWLKYTILTPSFFAKNRLFVEKSFRDKKIYSTFNFTQKSFIWSKINSTVITNFVIKSRKTINQVYLALFFLIIIVYTLHSLGGYDIPTSPIWQTLIYIFWRLFDYMYFIFLQIQYLIIIYLFSIIFFIFNTTIQANLDFFAWMEKNFAEIPLRPKNKSLNQLFSSFSSTTNFWSKYENFNMLKLFCRSLNVNELPLTDLFTIQKTSSQNLFDYLLLTKFFYQIQNFNIFNYHNLFYSANKNNWFSLIYLNFQTSYKNLYLHDHLGDKDFYLMNFIKNKKIFEEYSLNLTSKCLKFHNLAVVNDLNLNFFKNLKLSRWLYRYTNIHNNDLFFLQNLIKEKNNYFNNLKIFNKLPTQSLNDIDKFLNKQKLFLTNNRNLTTFNINNWFSSYNWILNRWLFTSNISIRENFKTLYAINSFNNFSNLNTIKNNSVLFNKLSLINYIEYAIYNKDIDLVNNIKKPSFLNKNFLTDLTLYTNITNNFTVYTYRNFIGLLQDMSYLNYSYWLNKYNIITHLRDVELYRATIESIEEIDAGIEPEFIYDEYIDSGLAPVKNFEEWDDLEEIQEFTKIDHYGTFDEVKTDDTDDTDEVVDIDEDENLNDLFDNKENRVKFF